MKKSDFWRGVRILIRNYHAVNKSIFACIIKKVYLFQNVIDINKFSTTLEVNEEYKEINENALFELLENIDDTDISGGALVQFKCIGKKQKENIEILGILDFSNCSYTCKFDCPTFCDFRVSCKDDRLEAEQIIINNSIGTERNQWLECMLLPKLKKWCENTKISNATVKDLIFPTCSLQLVDIEGYANIYKNLKIKYADKYLTIWKNAQECTNPLKFIHEDLAIAAYLISLWQCTSHKPTAFADLGCGNGLLVDVLNAEGYSGYGYDIRARRLWFYYSTNGKKLIEKAIDPCKTDWLPPEVDWLIGNHSDELSPWLPVLAARAHYKMSYFLLPCCAFELSGAKFQRRNSRLSTYQDFYLYAQELSNKCGFLTLQDRLKIPSTKRLALIGLQRSYSVEEFSKFNQNILHFVDVERQSHAVAGDEIKLREKHELVRNCTQIDKDVLLTLVLRVFHLMLETTENVQTWQRGRALHLREIAKHLDTKDLKQIKAECGGIKTLLRNHHAVFECQGQDIYSIRIPQPMKNGSREKPATIKKRKCFFKLYHPKGCPLDDKECSFIH